VGGETRGGLTTPEAAGAATAGIVVHVADVDTNFQEAKAKGATISKNSQFVTDGSIEPVMRKGPVHPAVTGRLPTPTGTSC
jgi:hypothetical protein